ncbi:hypothetical protein IPC448_25655 [Pseudomonas aeruginosa]|nr:hypothetical protein IPC448_25655 [Pseudomonas aeruginosa]
MLFASTPADKAILPTAWGGRYFFNRIGRLPPVTTGSYRARAAFRFTCFSTAPALRAGSLSTLKPRSAASPMNALSLPLTNQRTHEFRVCVLWVH